MTEIPFVAQEVVYVSWADTSGIPLSLQSFTSFVETVAPQMADRLPRTSEGFVAFKPEGKTYEEEWSTSRTNVPLAMFGVAAPAAAIWSMGMFYRPAGERVVTDAQGDPIILSGSIENGDAVYQMIEHGPEAEIVRQVERSGQIGLRHLPQLIETYISMQPLSDYVVPAELVALGAPATIETRIDAGGMRQFHPVRPRMRYL